MKRCSEKNFVYILRLLAGKSGRICIEFPLATFSAKILTTHPLKFPAINFLNSISCKNNVESTPIITSFLVKNYFRFKKFRIDQIYLLIRVFRSQFLARDACRKVFNEKTPWQAKDSSETWSVIDSFFSFCFKFRLVIRPIACHDVFSE